MNALLFRGLRASASLQSFTTYREVEQEHLQQHVTVNSEGEILEYETLELRIHPPNVEVRCVSYSLAVGGSSMAVIVCAFAAEGSIGTQ